MAESRIVRRYFREKQARGKRLIARVLDTVALLLLLFAGTYLFLRNKALRTEHALPLAIVASLFAGVILLIVRRASLLRFIPRETDRLSRKLLSERLCLLDGRRFRSLCRKASGERTPVVFQRAEPVSADELLPLLKKQKDATLTVCASAGFTKQQRLLPGTCRSVCVSSGKPRSSIPPCATPHSIRAGKRSMQRSNGISGYGAKNAVGFASFPSAQKASAHI